MQGNITTYNFLDVEELQKKVGWGFLTRWNQSYIELGNLGIPGPEAKVGTVQYITKHLRHPVVILTKGRTTPSPDFLLPSFKFLVC